MKKKDAITTKLQTQLNTESHFYVCGGRKIVAIEVFSSSFQITYSNAAFLLGNLILFKFDFSAYAYSDTMTMENYLSRSEPTNSLCYVTHQHVKSNRRVRKRRKDRKS